VNPQEQFDDSTEAITKLVPKPEPQQMEIGDQSDKVAVVTGGGWNIGRAIALRIARAGARVVICSRNEEHLAQTCEVARTLELDVRHIAADLTNKLQAQRVFDEILREEGRVDILACLAGGFGCGTPIHECDPDDWLDVVLRNLYSTFLCCRAVMPGMLERRKGDILTCAGGGAFFPMVGVNATAYASAKAGICRFTDQLYAEVMDVPGIRINCMEPGMTLNCEDLKRIEEEEAATGRPHPLREMNHSPEDAAELAAFLLGPASRELNGRIFAVDEEWWRDPDKVKAVAPTDLYRLRRSFLPDTID